MAILFHRFHYGGHGGGGGGPDSFLLLLFFSFWHLRFSFLSHPHSSHRRRSIVGVTSYRLSFVSKEIDNQEGERNNLSTLASYVYTVRDRAIVQLVSNHPLSTLYHRRTRKSD